MSRRLGLLERLAPELQEEMKLGLLEPGMARRLLGLPRGNQVELAAAARQGSLGVGQTEELVRLWRRAPTAEAQKFVLSHPTEALEAARSSPKQADDPRLSSQGQWVQRRLRAASTSLSKLSEAMGPGVSREDRTLLEEDFDDLSLQMKRVVSRAGRDDASGSEIKRRKGDATNESGS